MSRLERREGFILQALVPIWLHASHCGAADEVRHWRSMWAYEPLLVWTLEQLDATGVRPDLCAMGGCIRREPDALA